MDPGRRGNSKKATKETLVCAYPLDSPTDFGGTRNEITPSFSILVRSVRHRPFRCSGCQDRLFDVTIRVGAANRSYGAFSTIVASRTLTNLKPITLRRCYAFLRACGIRPASARVGRGFVRSWPFHADWQSDHGRGHQPEILFDLGNCFRASVPIRRPCRRQLRACRGRVCCRVLTNFENLSGVEISSNGRGRFLGFIILPDSPRCCSRLNAGGTFICSRGPYHQSNLRTLDLPVSGATHDFATRNRPHGYLKDREEKDTCTPFTSIRRPRHRCRPPSRGLAIRVTGVYRVGVGRGSTLPS